MLKYFMVLVVSPKWYKLSVWILYPCICTSWMGVVTVSWASVIEIMSGLDHVLSASLVSCCFPYMHSLCSKSLASFLVIYLCCRSSSSYCDSTSWLKNIFLPVQRRLTLAANPDNNLDLTVDGGTQQDVDPACWLFFWTIGKTIADIAIYSIYRIDILLTCLVLFGTSHTLKFADLIGLIRLVECWICLCCM